MAVADRASERPIAVQHSRPHPVLGLFRVLAALVLGDGGKDVFLQLAIGIVAKLDAGRFQRPARKADRGAKLDMGLHFPRQPGNVVNQDDGRCAAVLLQEGQHGLHAPALDRLACNVVHEGFNDGVAPCVRVLGAAGLLRTEAIAALGLRGAGYPAIDDGNLLVGLHGVSSFSSASSTAATLNSCVGMVCSSASTPFSEAL
ncbi:hypothetical protein QOZ23_04555 [Pseudomonas aeruginosa]